MPNEDLKKEIAEVAAETLSALLKASKEADEKEKAESAKPSWLNANLKAAASSLAVIVAILGSIWAIDTHYASAAELARVQQDLSAQIRQMRQEKVEDDLSILDARKLRQHGKLNADDQVSYDRLLRRSQSIQNEVVRSQQEKK